MKKIYLAVPYSGLEEISFNCANRVAALLMKEGHCVFSPISHSHPIQCTNIPENSAEFWLNQDKEFMNWADELWIINIQYDTNPFFGSNYIKKSKGVQQEIQWALDNLKPIRFINYNPQKDILNGL